MPRRLLTKRASSSSAVDQTIEAYWRSQTAIEAANKVLDVESAMSETYSGNGFGVLENAIGKRSKVRRKFQSKQRPASARRAKTPSTTPKRARSAARRRKGRTPPPRVAKLARSKIADLNRGESDIAWSRMLNSAEGWENSLTTPNERIESMARANYHEQQTQKLNASIKNERESLRESRRAARMRKRAKRQAHTMETLLPEENARGGLEGRELKSWKILMERHARVVSSAGVRVESKLDKHVEKRRKELAKKSRQRFEFATASDGGMTGNQLVWWTRQRELHDRVVKSASVRIDTKHEKHVKEERKRKQKMRKEKEANWSAEDGGLQGPEKKHWRIMTERHDKLIEEAKPTVETKLGKHVLAYREALERKKMSDGMVEAGLSGRELKNWKLFQKVHNKIIDDAKPREESHLAGHVLRYRRARQKKSKVRFEKYDTSSGGLQGPALKSWQSVKKTHDHVIETAKVRVDLKLPRHVEEERARLRMRGYEKWKSFDPDVNGGLHGVELEHWKIMHKLHDKLVATAKPTMKISLDPHVEKYRNYLKKKHELRWSEPDNAGLEGRELKWWREQKEIYENLKASATSTLKREKEMELPKHVSDYREYLNKQRADRDKTRGPNDGMLSGPDLEHWRIMRKIHDELIQTAKKTVSVDHEKHVKRHMAYVVKRSKKRWDPKLGFTAGLEGPELHHWREMTKLHERVVGSAKPQVDSHHKKTVAEEAMNRQLFEKWGGLAYSADLELKKKRARLRRKRAKERRQKRDAKRNKPLLSEAQYQKAIKIARMVHSDVYKDSNSDTNSDSQDSESSDSYGSDSYGSDSHGSEFSNITSKNSDRKEMANQEKENKRTNDKFSASQTSLLMKTALPSWQSIRSDTDYVGQAAWRQGPSDFDPEAEMEEIAHPSYTRTRLTAALQAASMQNGSTSTNSFGEPLYKRSPISFAAADKR